jgi:hypothetical protein
MQQSVLPTDLQHHISAALRLVLLEVHYAGVGLCSVFESGRLHSSSHPCTATTVANAFATWTSPFWEMRA